MSGLGQSRRSYGAGGRGMSASPPIASALWHRSEMTLRANRVLTRRSTRDIRKPRPHAEEPALSAFTRVFNALWRASRSMRSTPGPVAVLRDASLARRSSGRGPSSLRGLSEARSGGHRDDARFPPFAFVDAGHECGVAAAAGRWLAKSSADRRTRFYR